jgi:hypothetical protein
LDGFFYNEITFEAIKNTLNDIANMDIQSFIQIMSDIRTYIASYIGTNHASNPCTDTSNYLQNIQLMMNRVSRRRKEVCDGKE